MAQILLIPGLLCDETVWQPLLAQLGGKAAVADLSTQDDLTTMAQDCLAAHPGKLRIAGHSMGARVAMEMARAAPGRIERLALLDTGMHPLKEGERERRAEIVRFAHDRGMAALAERWLPGMVHAPNREDAALMRSLTDMVLAKDADLHERQITALVNRPDASAYLGSITCPVLLVVGEEDQWSPVAQHAEMARLLPRPRLEVIPGAGHFAPLEQPEAVAGLVAEFLTGEG
jgi:pimeloyl-ACP methyl ester carboxylesterase